MTDDPTTKSCHGRSGFPCDNGRTIAYADGRTARCDICHGTGRVPMNTGELLEAARKTHQDVSLYIEGSLGDIEWCAELSGRDDGKNACGYGKTPDDALRDALRAVTP